MGTAFDSSEITLAEGIIRRPDEPRHFMSMNTIGRKIVIRQGSNVLAKSADAIRLMEVGRQMYDPIIYVPRSAVVVPLERSIKSSHCPLKGTARGSPSRAQKAPIWRGVMKMRFISQKASVG